MKKLSILITLFISCFLFSCSEEKPKENVVPVKQIQSSGKTVKTDIGRTGLTIELPDFCKLHEEKGKYYSVYYITDTIHPNSSAGIYFGPYPDLHGPDSVLSKNVRQDTLLGQPATITDYITPDYETIETVISMADGNKLHYWYSAFTPPELQNMESLMRSIKQKNN